MTSGSVDGASGRVLVVEDDPETALFVVHVLANRGRFEVTHTADPATALRLAAAEHWDLLVTDLDMPGMTGLELLGALRRVAPGLPVAMVSAHAPGEMTAALLGHADEYLEKPLRVNQLIATATALIARGRAAFNDGSGLPHRDRGWPRDYPPMPVMDGDGCRLLMDAPGDGDMPVMDGDGEEPMFMLMVMPPSGMLWWTGTHQFQTFSCGAPATTPIRWPSSWVQTVYSRPWLKVQYTRPAACSSLTVPALIWATV